MFAGRRFDIEIGLYYNRARYYNPFTGRFLQADPIGYGDGMNMYAYCGNNSLNRADPSGLAAFMFLNMDHKDAVSGRLTFAKMDGSDVIQKWDFAGLDDWLGWIQGKEGIKEGFNEEWMESQTGWLLSRNFSDDTGKHDQDWFFWELQKLRFISGGAQIGSLENQIRAGKNVKVRANYKEARGLGYNYFKAYDSSNFTIFWNPDCTTIFKSKSDRNPDRGWHEFPALVGLAHEIAHGADWAWKGLLHKSKREQFAVTRENIARWGFYNKVPGHNWVKPRPGVDRRHADITWSQYWNNPLIYPYAD